MPDPNLDRLKAVSLTLALRIRPSDRPRHPNVSTSVTFTEQDVNTIAADLLRLADEVNRQRVFIGGVANGEYPDNTGAAQKFLMPPMKRVTPASGNAKTEEE